MTTALFVDSPFGRIGIAEREGAIVNIFFPGTVQPDCYTEGSSPLLERAAAQLTEYFAGERVQFDLPLRFSGTPFEREVWQALLEVPYGQTRSYADIAAAIGKPAACRAVGRANGRNPISIIAPCHRIIGKSGKLTGYAGGLPMKQALLKLETNRKGELR